MPDKFAKIFFFPLVLGFFLLGSLGFPQTSFAIYDPLSVPNNKLGVHLLNPEEIERAASIVNSQEGDWGYVTVPIQPSDRDQKKWSRFMNRAQTLHLIPIIRITTLPHGGTWGKAQATDLVDFANFLNELPWPIENRYIVLFNEVNRAGEWGGKVDPEKYASILRNARTIFKERNRNFFLLGPALDSAVPDSETSLSASRYLRRMEEADPTIWSYLDGWASHSYPNPEFSASPSKTGWQSIVSYRTETSTLRLAPKPVFITETGWSQTALPPKLIDSYWRQAWSIWNSDQEVVAVTPFVLLGGEQYRAFSLIGSSGNLTSSGNALQSLAKTKGQPHTSTLSSSPPVSSSSPPQNQKMGTNNNFFPRPSQGILLRIENFFRKLFGLQEKRLIRIGSQTLMVELADRPNLWEKGLSERKSLSEKSGMLFVFPSPHTPVFWMKNMQFPLDIIWLRNNSVVAINASVPVPKNGQFPTYSPPEDIDMVLEVPAGFSTTVSLQVGDQLTILD